MENEMETEKLPAVERRWLRSFERDAMQGRKLGSKDRLAAAFHLTRVWNAANAKGLRKEDFQDQILAELTRPHAARQEFRLANWTLRRGEDPRVEDLRAIYAARSTPHRALEPYLAGIAVAARYCGEDPDQWKLDMMRDLSIWGQRKTELEVQPADDRPTETLAMLISAMCTALGNRNSLQDTFDAVSSMNCRWEMFWERLVATDSACMQDWRGRINDVGAYFEEMFPFPSTSLVQVPYLYWDTTFVLAPESKLQDSLDDGAAMFANLFAGFASNSIADDAHARMEVSGQLRWYRDVRLCILPDGHRGFVAGLESRPHVEVVLEGEHDVAGLKYVIGGFEPSLQRPLYYSKTTTGQSIWPHVLSRDGDRWRICVSDPAEISDSLIGMAAVRDAETVGWQFDADPVGAPGQVFSEPWYLSYTPATPAYLRYWLTRSWQLGELTEQCTWARGSIGGDWDDPKSRWSRDLPPIRELNFPGFNSATWVECCLHNGLIEEALQASIDRLKSQAAELQAEWQLARDRNAQKLLARWHITHDEKDRI